MTQVVSGRCASEGLKIFWTVEIRIESVDIVLPLDRSEDDAARREAVAAKVGAMSGADIVAAVHAVFVAAPEQQCTRSSLTGKQQGATLGGEARVACEARGFHGR